MEQSLFINHPKFQNFDKIFYCSTTRLTNTSLCVFIQCRCTRTMLRNKNMGQNHFTKHSKFRTYEEIFYCCKNRLRNTWMFLQNASTQELFQERKIWDRV